MFFFHNFNNNNDGNVILTKLRFISIKYRKLWLDFNVALDMVVIFATVQTLVCKYGYPTVWDHCTPQKKSESHIYDTIDQYWVQFTI
jgi:hypothetical protein